MKVKDHSVSGEVFSLVYDKENHMYTTTPKPKEDNLGAYYDSVDYISHTDGKRSIFERGYQFIKGIALSRKQNLLNSYLPNKGKVLDIGAGTGDFLAHLVKSSWKVAGVEPNPKARGLAKNKGVRLASALNEISESFDAITMWHVLEHVYDLEAQISWLKKHLNTQGSLFIAVPNFESLDAQEYGEFWAAYDVPRHLYHFSQQSIKLLFIKHGMELVRTEPMIFDAYYVSLLSEKYQTGRMNFLNAAWKGWKSNRSAKKTGNYSSLIYVLRHKNP